MFAVQVRGARSLWETVEIPQLQHVSCRTRSLTYPLCQRQVGCQSAENCDGPAVAAHLTRWSISFLAVIDTFWTSCDHAATSALVLEVPQFLFIARAGGHSVVQQRMVLDLVYCTGEGAF